MLKITLLRVKNSNLLILFFALFPGSLFAQLQADFYADKTGGCSPLTVSFTNATRGASESAVFYWEFGNGNTSALRNPGAIYRDETSYPVKLTVTDQGR